MYEYTTKNTQTARQDTNSKISDFKIVSNFIVRIASLFAIYFLLNNNFTIVNCIVCLFLIASLLTEIVHEK